MKRDEIKTTADNVGIRGTPVPKGTVVKVVDDATKASQLPDGAIRKQVAASLIAGGKAEGHESGKAGGGGTE